MPQAMEHNQLPPGWPGIITLGISIFLQLSFWPTTLGGWVSIFGVLVTSSYYGYKMYLERKNQKK